jgi:nucleoside-diphosphate-sugar epimerase
MMPAGRPVLVTGAAGFIGRHLIERLATAGVEVRGLVRRGGADPAGHDDQVASPLSPPPRWQRCTGDLEDPASLQAAARDVGTIYHLASYNGPGLDSPAEAFGTNGLGTLNLLEAARAAGARVVLVSSSHVFGRPARLPVSEDCPLRPLSPYAASKVAAEALAACYGAAYGVDIAVVRPFNVYGPGQSARAVIPTIISQALAGGSVRLHALGPRRDFVFVADLVEALMLCGRHPAAVGGSFNLGSGTDRSVGEIVEETFAALGLEAPVIESGAGGPPDRIVCDPGRARAVLQWEARTPFRDGLRQTIDWWRSRVPAAQTA